MSERTSSRSCVESGADFAARWRAWHDEVDRTRRDRHGVLALTGLVWLEEHTQAIPSVPGAWAATGQRAWVEASEPDRLIHDGALVTDRRELEVPATLTFPGGSVELAARGPHVIARSRLDASPFLAAFGGTDTYDPDPAWVLTGRFRPTPGTTVQVEAATGRFQHELEAVGTVTVTVDGVAHTLQATPAFETGTARLTFRDETSGRTTAPQGRTVVFDLPTGDGEVVIDFTRATNLPCAYSDFGTCALPAAQNTLAAAVTAGEKAPTIRLVAGDDGRARLDHVAV